MGWDYSNHNGLPTVDIIKKELKPGCLVGEIVPGTNGTYFAACRLGPQGELPSKVIAVCFMVDRNSRQIGLKMIDETAGPYAEPLNPEAFLKRLSPIDDNKQWGYAKNWRNRCLSTTTVNA